MLSKSQARAFFLGGTGLFTAAFLTLTIDTHRRIPARTHSDAITPEVVRGKRIWESNNCMGCHTLFGEGAYYAPELTKSVERRGKAFLRIFLKDPQVLYPGQRKMVKYDFTAEQIEDVIAFLDWCGKVDLNGFPAPPPLGKTVVPVAVQQRAVVPAGVEVPALFAEKTCLACHSLLGKGTPNVMLPSTTGELVAVPSLDEVYLRKTREELVTWITDPQKIKPGTPMPTLVPAVVSPAEVQQIVDFLMGLNPAARPANSPKPN
ncbi:MAG: c-type cytochrome [Akkermansiaceae bacterium]|nr:c-type cytochrome [Akkermansiaceae bacterium]MCP5551511.1 c-type cytochrome [Akkermansiaceae bacterium]